MSTKQAPSGWLRQHLLSSQGKDKYKFIVEQSIHHFAKMLALCGKDMMLEAHRWYVDEHFEFAKHLSYA